MPTEKIEDWHLELTVPKTHLLTQSPEAHDPSDIIGSLFISAPFSTPDSSLQLSQVNIQLLQSVLPRKIAPACAENKRHRFLPRLSREQRPPTSAVPLNEEVVPWVECRLSHAPDEIRHLPDKKKIMYRYSFSIPVPHNIPTTINTVLGSVSYSVAATMHSPRSPAGAQSLHDSVPVRIFRAVALEPIVHSRRYPDGLVTRILVTPKQPCCPRETEQTASYAVQWLAESTIMRGKRPEELRYVVAKDLQWRLDEVVKHLVISGTGEMLHQEKYTRRLCSGREKGRWIASGRVPGQSDNIKILFDICIHTDIAAAYDIDIAAYTSQYRHLQSQSGDSKRSAITVEHQLHIEVITGEDTFHTGSGDLVDRKLRVNSYNAVFPLPVRSFIADPGSPNCPPRYEAPYILSPDYARVQYLSTAT